MVAKFYRMTLSVLDSELATNADSIKAVMPRPEKGVDVYRVWLNGSLAISADISTRIAQLGGVTPLSQDWWDVKSNDLGELFSNAPKVAP